MPRPRRDGAPAAAPNKRKLSDIFLKKLKPQSCAFTVWEDHQRTKPYELRTARAAGHAATQVASTLKTTRKSCLCANATLD